MSLITRLFGASTDATILCPRCERAMEGHDDGACARKMSRRWFIGATAGVAAIAGLRPFPFAPTIVRRTGVSLSQIVAIQNEYVRDKYLELFSYRAITRKGKILEPSPSGYRLPFTVVRG